MYRVEDANTGEILESGFATISDALDASERIDPDESRGVYACLCPDDCNCRHCWRRNYCGCTAHDS